MKTHSHTITSLFKGHDSVVSRVFRVVQLSLLLSEHFHHPKRNLYPLAASPSPWQPQI